MGEYIEEMFTCEVCSNEFKESELVEDDYAQYKGFSEEHLCPVCDNRID